MQKKTLQQLFADRDVEGIKTFMAANDLVVKDGHIVPRDEVSADRLIELSKFWNQRQQARKILLNSLN